MSLIEAKLHCRVDHTADDALIGGFIAAVRAQLDGRDGLLGRSLVTQTWDYKLAAFPASGAALELPLAPVASITSVTYLDAGGALQTWSSSEYMLYGGDEAYLSEKESYSYPATAITPESVVVRFVSGYGAPSLVPEPIRAAILLMVEDLYDRPESRALRDRAMCLLTPYRMHWL